MEPSSFSFHLIRGEALVYRSTTSTPPGPSGAFLVTVTNETMDRDVIKAWFVEASTPLVGPEAAAILRKLLEPTREDAKDFLQKALEFRLTLK